MRYKVMCVIMALIIFVFSGCGENETTNSGEIETTTNFDALNHDYEGLVEFSDGEYAITSECDWLPAELRFQWDQSFNNEIDDYEAYFYFLNPNESTNLRDKDFLEFLGACLDGTKTQPLDPVSFLERTNIEIHQDEWEDIVYRYLDITAQDSGFDYTSHAFLDEMLTHEIEDGCIDANKFPEYFQGYARDDIAKMAYIVEKVNNDNMLDSSELSYQIQDHYAQTDRFLFYVSGVKGYKERIRSAWTTDKASNNLLFEYYVGSKTVAFRDVYDPTIRDGFEPIYALEEIPTGYMSEQGYTALDAYMDENGWSY